MFYRYKGDTETWHDLTYIYATDSVEYEFIAVDKCIFPEYGGRNREELRNDENYEKKIRILVCFQRAMITLFDKMSGETQDEKDLFTIPYQPLSNCGIGLIVLEWLKLEQSGLLA